jgi:hypothetical protein
MMTAGGAHARGFTRRTSDIPHHLYPHVPSGGIMTSGTLHVMSREHGDIRKEWDPSNEDEVADARRTFEFFKGEKRYLAYRVNDNGEPGETMSVFDENAGAIIMSPQPEGG